jgi:hypothetical protein
VRRVLFGVLLVGLGLTLAGRADAQQPPPTPAPPTSVPPEGGVTEPESGVTGGGTEGGQPPATLPLVPVPAGCTAPPLPHIVFVGKVVDRDFRSVRFEIEQIRAGQAAPFAAGNEIDVRYGLDAQYLDDGERYLVSAPVDADLGLLVSRVTPVIENFGGDEVIGVSESDVNCPAFENPLRTLHLDGTPIEASALEPFFASKIRILGAVAVPIAVAAGVIFLLATFRLSIAGLYRSVVDTVRRPR